MRLAILLPNNLIIFEEPSENGIWVPSRNPHLNKTQFYPMGKRRKSKKQPVWLIILVILLAFAFVVSRSLRNNGFFAATSDTIQITNLLNSDNKQESDKNRSLQMQNGENKSPSNKDKHNNSIQPEKPIIKHLEMLNPPERPDKKLLLGKASPSQRDLLMVSVAPGFGNRDGLLMHRDAYNAFMKMHQAAQQEGISLIIISAYRSFDHQKRIWENKWNGRQMLSDNIAATSIKDPEERAAEILRFSSMPGTSRHHWGTDIDINNLNNSYFLNGKGLKEYQWLKKNAHTFGFCQPYTRRSARNNRGYEEEKWHWSYRPLASVYLETFKDSVQYQDLNGFDGWQTAQPLSVIENYVMGINSECY